ncbi:MAG: NAD(P)H-dependent oxidoreductase [Gammaproteobacteria bacterium]|nr:NAD(P)H-dependent oxidoreductase [Gammaproteobacteria bacterium]
MSTNEYKTILRIDSSLRGDDSISRRLGDNVVERLLRQHPNATVEHVDLAGGMPSIDAAWVAANFTAAEQRSAVQRERLAASDAAVAQLRRADAIVLTTPVYNFSVPAALRDWIDHVCRAGMTFRYTEHGPEGLLADRPVYLVVASGGVELGGPVDFASTYLRQVFRFIGISDVHLVGAERTAADSDAAVAGAMRQLDQRLPAVAGAVA